MPFSGNLFLSIKKSLKQTNILQNEQAEPCNEKTFIDLEARSNEAKHQFLLFLSFVLEDQQVGMQFVSGFGNQSSTDPLGQRIKKEKNWGFAPGYCGAVNLLHANQHRSATAIYGTPTYINSLTESRL